MRVALVTLEFPPSFHGGAGVYAGELATHIAEMGVEVHVVVPGTTSDGERLGRICVHRTARRFSRVSELANFWFEQHRTLKRIEHDFGRLDVVHYNGPVFFPYVPYMGATVRVLTVHHSTASLVKVLSPPLWSRLADIRGELGIGPVLERCSVGRVDRILTPSHHTRNDLVAIGVPGERIDVVYPGLRLEKQANVADAQSSPGGDQAYTFVSIGRLEHRKGVDILLRGFAHALGRTRKPARLYVVGEGNAAPYRALAAQLGIAGSVQFMGRLSDAALATVYTEANCLVMASRYEGFGLVAVEAAARGLSVIVSDAGSLAEVAELIGASVFRSTDVEQLSEMMVSTMRGRQGVSRREGIPTWPGAAALVLGIYEHQLRHVRS